MSTPPILRFGDGEGLRVDLPTLIATRLLIQGSSGAGKSYLTRYLLEQTHGQIQQIVIDPEGEFATLRERFDYVIASAGGDGDVPADPSSAKLLCRQLIELGASAILDVYELDVDDRQAFVGRFLRELLALPRSLWRPVLVVIDEAHDFAPEGGSAPPSLKPVKDLVTRGRKRGFGSVLSTQRISKLHKDAADLLNVLVGRTGLDVDVRRAGDMLGFDKAQREELKLLEPGEFFAFGPAISREVIRVRSGEVQTTHPKPGEIAPPTPPAPERIRALLEQLHDLPERAAEEERTIEALERRIRELEVELREARRGAPAPPDPEEIERAVRAAIAEHDRKWTRALGSTVRLLGKARGLARDLDRVLGEIAWSDTPEVPEAPPAPRPVVERPVPSPHAPGTTVRDSARKVQGASDVSGPQQRMLDALAWFASMGLDRIDRRHVAVFSGQSPKSSGFRKNLSTLSSAGLIQYLDGGDIALTAEGAALAAPAERPRTLDELHRAWGRYLSGPQARMLEALVNYRGRPVSREDLARWSGQSPASSGFRKNLSVLSSLGLLHYPDGETAAATELLFPEGLS